MLASEFSCSLFLSFFIIAFLLNCIHQGALRKKERWSSVLFSPGISIVSFSVVLLELISCFRKFRGITNRLRGTGRRTEWPLLVQE